MKTGKIKLLTFTGMFAALVFLATWSLHVPSGINGGYIHLGDAMVYTAAVMLPTPFAMLAAAVGAGLSDLLSPGAAVWAPATIIIKSLCCLPFTCKSESLLNKRNIIALFICAAITTVGYGIATWIISGSALVAITEMPLSLIQSAGSTIVFVAISAALDRTKLKNVMTTALK